MSKKYYEELIKIAIEKNLSKDELSKLKTKLCKKYKLREPPTDIEVMLHATPPQAKKLSLITKPTRSISGVTPVAIMSHPFKCPHGECIMCPSNTKKGIPQSYTGAEPATMRGVRHEFNSYAQVFNRLEQYIVAGHTPQKVELIIMGGTFPSYLKHYQDDFIMYAFKAMNDFSKLFFKKGCLKTEKFKKFFELPGKIGDLERAKRIHTKICKLKKKTTLKKEQRKNEKTYVRCVGLTIETRPDYGLLEQANQMLKLGTTRVELGIQSVYDKALERIERGHTVNTSTESIRILKDLGFKLNFHYMPGLPGINKKDDLEGMKELFTNSAFQPDMLKLYPCMVIPGTKLYKQYKENKFKPLSTKEAVSMIKEFKKTIPPYCRVMRVQRDIPTSKTTAGVDRTNLRQMIEQEKDFTCRCIRCREAGHVYQKKGIMPKNVKLVVQEYAASGGIEYFISAEDVKQDILVGFCRLRFPSQSLRKEITDDSALLRELHVYGVATPLGVEGGVQHRGWGKKLLLEAEKIARKSDKKKLVIISGIGVRGYYKKLGYRRDGPYMSKKL
ncbi:tRNA uridine(34) 5-carboxymethylaminomethyl modification radical SAM/GNAT enzyme Elp3 [Candidatus Woesearchaeota archaeon]|nr:tRNA uridine(34) 5-carboxymethylaminomethyl modification radical SAM/GNAT enzyme Elp3 [Candidatus Woesearchaeota archaeon]